MILSSEGITTRAKRESAASVEAIPDSSERAREGGRERGRERAHSLILRSVEGRESARSNQKQS